MHCSLISYRYEKSTPGALIQGVKGGKTLENAIGMNGTSRMYSNPPSVRAVVKDRFDCPINVDLYNAIKKELEEIGMRISEKRVKKICDFLINENYPFEIVLDGHNHWIFRDFDIRSIIDRRND